MRHHLLFFSKLRGWLLCCVLATGTHPMVTARHAGQLLSRPVTLKMENVLLTQALRELGTRAGVKFAYSPDQLGDDVAVSIDVRERPLGEVLDELLTPLRIRYQVHEATFTITLRRSRPERTPRSEVVTPASSATQPVILISGTVKDAVTGQPLTGVNVVVKGTTTGVTTDRHGRYQLEAEVGDFLVFSFIGYQTQEIQVDGRAIIDVSLDEDIRSLDEVVVNAGYYTTADAMRTGTIERLDAEDMKDQAVGSPLQALAGRLPGVYIQQQSGVPGGTFTVQIRGQNSLRNGLEDNGNRPLYIVDGVPFSSAPMGTINSGAIVGGGHPLNYFNPGDIASIEVLKDADATAIYGSRGANGVVLITTKKGKERGTHLEGQLYHGVGFVRQRMDLLDAAGYLAMRREALAQDGMAPGDVFPDADLLQWDTTRSTDWQDALLGGSTESKQAQLSFSGGSDEMQFSTGGTYYHETALFGKNFGNRKLSTHVNLVKRGWHDRVTLDLSAYFLDDINELPRVDFTPYALSLPPTAPSLRDEAGRLNWAGSTWSNPLALLEQDFHSHTRNLVGNATVRARILRGLEGKVSLGYNALDYREYTTQPSTSFDPEFYTGSVSTFGDRLQTTWIAEPQLSYRGEGLGGRWELLAGGTLQGSESGGKALMARGFSSDAMLGNLQAATSIVVQRVDHLQYRYGAFFGRVHYNLRDRYLFHVTGRRDGSSRFGPRDRYATFGALGAAWIFTNERWLKDRFTFPVTGKIRGSYGTTGSDQIGDYGYLDLWNATGTSYAGVGGLVPTRLKNPQYGWEETTKVEGAIDLGFYDDRLQLTAQGYRNVTRHQLVGIALPASTGFSSLTANFPAEVLNYGGEFIVSATPIARPRFEWNSVITLTVPQSRLTRFDDIERSSFRFDYAVGKPLGIFPAYRYLGVDEVTGTYRFEDSDGDGNLTPEGDYQALRAVRIAYYGGVQNSLKYDGFELRFFLQFVKQSRWSYQAFFVEPPGTATNQPVEVMQRWQQPGDRTYVQVFTQDFGDAYFGHYHLTNRSDRLVTDASFVRLKTLSLTYSLPTRLLGAAGLRSGSVFVQGQNLFTLTRYTGLDPETQSSSLPPLQQFTAGLRFQF